MKLLFDQNLSPALPRRLIETFPNSIHVVTLGLLGRPDEDIASFARQEGYVVCTKDEDFKRDDWLIAGNGPSVILLRIGNSTTGEVVATLIRNAAAIEAIAKDTSPFFVELAS